MCSFLFSFARCVVTVHCIDCDCHPHFACNSSPIDDCCCAPPQLRYNVWSWLQWLRVRQSVHRVELRQRVCRVSLWYPLSRSVFSKGLQRSRVWGPVRGRKLWAWLCWHELREVLRWCDVWHVMLWREMLRRLHRCDVCQKLRWCAMWCQLRRRKL